MNSCDEDDTRKEPWFWDMTKLSHKNKMHMQWRQGYSSCEYYRPGSAGRGSGKSQHRSSWAWLEMLKNNKKGFFKYICQQRELKETVLPVMSEEADLAKTDMEGWGTQWIFCLSSHWQKLEPRSLCPRRKRQGLGEWSTIHCMRRLGLRPSKEYEGA